MNLSVPLWIIAIAEVVHVGWIIGMDISSIVGHTVGNPFVNWLV